MCWHDITSAPFSASGHSLVAVCSVFRLSFIMLHIDKHWICNMSVTLQIVTLLFTRLSSFGPLVLMFSFSVDVLSVRHLHQRSHCFWTGITLLRNLCYSRYLLSTATFNISEVSIAFFILFTVKSYASMLFFQVCRFLGIPKLEMETTHTHTHTLVLSKTLFNNHMCYRHIPGRNYSANSTVSTPKQ
jgi:hypothetical protein